MILTGYGHLVAEPPVINQNHRDLLKTSLQAERQRKEDADAHRKAEDEAKKKIALSNMGSSYSSLQRVSSVYSARTEQVLIS